MLKNINKINFEYILLTLVFIISSLYLIINKNNDLFSILFLNTIFFIPLLIYFKYDNKKTTLKKFPLFEIIITLFFLTNFIIFYFDYDNYLFKSINRDLKIYEDNVSLIETKQTIVDKILQIYIIAFSILIISYYFFKYLISKIKFVEICFFQDQSHILKLAYFLFVGYFIMDVNSYFKNISIITEIKILFLYTSLLIFFYSKNNYMKFLKYFLVLLLFSHLTIKTFIMPILSCTILILSIELIIKNKINFVILTIFLFTFYYVNLTKSIHRQNLKDYNYDTNSITIMENVYIFLNYSSQKKTSKEIKLHKNAKYFLLQQTDIKTLQQTDILNHVYKTDQQFENLLRRISMSSQTLTNIIYYNDVMTKYEGRTIKFALYSFVPSLIWKNKPSFNFANEFGRDFNFIDKSDYKTSINIPFLTELYLNYYFKGIVIGMILFGLLISITEYLILIFFNKDKIFSFILISSTFSFTYIETAAMFIVNGFIVKIMFLFAIIYGLYVITNKFKQR